MSFSSRMTDTSRSTPRRLSPLDWALQLSVYTALWAIPFALFFGVMNGGTREVFVLCYRVSLVFSLFIRAALLLTETFVAPRLYAAERLGRGHWATDGAIYVVASIIAAYLAAIVVNRFVWSTFLDGPRAWLVTGLFTLLFSILFTGIAYARVFYRQALERAAQVERIRAELAQAELRALRAQINPHFLFNTLNTIAALINENPSDAEDVVTRLAEVFRYVLTSAQREHSRFGDELEFLRSYLEIERSRLGERLTLIETIEPDLESILIPSLLLQPLVENAVRYAVAGRTGGGRITLAAHRTGESLVVEITDDGPGFVTSATPQGHGVGLESVRERLRLAGPGHAFVIHSSPETGTRAVLTFPLSPVSHRPAALIPTEAPRCG